MSPTAGPRVKLTNAEKVLYPATGTTKSDIFDYYTRIAEVMIPHIAGRPATRKRWPNGVEQESFFEKQLAASAPDWLPRASVTHRSGTTTYPIIDDPTGLAWIAQQAALEVHVPQWRFVAEWTRSRAEELKPGPATRLVFDLDPGDGVTMAQMSKVARRARPDRRDRAEHLPAHQRQQGTASVCAARRAGEQQRRHGVGQTRCATAGKDDAQARHVDHDQEPAGGEDLLDWSQNNGSKTTIAPYSLRGREHPTVAAPRTWDELDDPSLRQLRYDEVLSRVARDGDLLAELDEDAPVPDRLTKYRSMRDASKTPSRFRRRNPLSVKETPSSSRNTTRDVCTTIFG